MKKNLLTLATVAMASLSVYAQAPSFKELMKQMGGDFKILATEAKTGTFAADALPAAQDLLKTVQLAQVTTPDTDVLDPALPNYASAKVEFDSLLKQEADLAQVLVNALAAGDTATAIDSLNKMGAIKNDGHDQFKH